MVRSAVLLFGDVCGMIVGVGCVGVFWNGHEDRFTNPTEPAQSGAKAPGAEPKGLESLPNGFLTEESKSGLNFRRHRP